MPALRCRACASSRIGWWCRPAPPSIRLSRSRSERWPSAMLEPTSFRNLGDAIARTGDRDAPALIDLGGETGPRIFSYRALDARDRRDGARLARARAPDPRDRIAILSANRAEFLIGFLGSMRAWGWLRRRPTSSCRRETLHHVLRDSDAQAGAVRCAAPSMSARPTCPASSSAHPTASMRCSTRWAVRARAPGPPGAPAMFLYTSGSSGRPKGVVLSHEAHLWAPALLARPRRSRSRGNSGVLVAAPLYHMNTVPLSHLPRHLLAARHGRAAARLHGGRAISRRPAAYRCTTLTSVPTMIALALRERALLAKTDVSSVRVPSGWARRRSPRRWLDGAKAPPSPTPRSAMSTAPPRPDPIVFGAHPEGLPTPDLSVGYPAPREWDARLVAGDDRDADQGVLAYAMPSADDCLPQAAGGDARRDDRRRLLCQRRRAAARSGRLLLFRRPRRRHVRVQRREHLSGRGRGHRPSAIRRSTRPASCRCPTKIRGPEAGRLCCAARPARP